MIAEIKGHDRLAIIWAEKRPARSAGRTRRSASTSTTPTRWTSFEFMGFPYTPGEQAGYPAVIQQVSDYLQGAENPAVFMGIAAPDCASFIQGLRSAGEESAVYTSNSCDDESVRGLPESAGTFFETPGFIVEQPELYSEFTQFMLAEREAALDAYGPQSPRGSFMRSMFSAVLFVYQVANAALARRRRHRRPGGVPRGDRHASRTSTCSATSRCRAPGTSASTSRSASARPTTRCGTESRYTPDTGHHRRLHRRDGPAPRRRRSIAAAMTS